MALPFSLLGPTCPLFLAQWFDFGLWRIVWDPTNFVLHLSECLSTLPLNRVLIAIIRVLLGHLPNFVLFETCCLEVFGDRLLKSLILIVLNLQYFLESLGEDNRFSIVDHPLEVLEVGLAWRIPPILLIIEFVGDLEIVPGIIDILFNRVDGLVDCHHLVRLKDLVLSLLEVGVRIVHSGAHADHISLLLTQVFI